MDDFFKWPRLFIPDDLAPGKIISLPGDQAHYITHVLRKKTGDPVRLFNGRGGEWKSTIDSVTKKSTGVRIDTLIRPYNPALRRIHFLFAPIKKQRQDWMIEKAVELGATDFHPVLTQNTEVRDINEDRLHTQICEAAEQNERLDIPALHPLKKLEPVLSGWNKTIPLLSCVERSYKTPALDAIKDKSDIAFLVGPEGGFTREEKEYLTAHTTPVTLGDTVLRCETAAVMMLSLLKVL